MIISYLCSRKTPFNSNTRCYTNILLAKMKNQYKWDFGRLEVAVCYLATYLAETMEID